MAFRVEVACDRNPEGDVARYDWYRDSQLSGSSPQPAAGDPSFVFEVVEQTVDFVLGVEVVDLAGNRSTRTTYPVHLDALAPAKATGLRLLSAVWTAPASGA